MNNTKMHRKLALLYGNKCMFLQAHCEDLGYIKYKGKYKSKELERLIKNITVHHLKHRFEGGKTTIENCSLVNELAHRYIHTLPRAEEEKINNKIREWKKLKIEYVDDLNLQVKLNFAEMSIDKQGKLKLQRMRQQERRDEKREIQRIKKEYEDR